MKTKTVTETYGRNAHIKGYPHIYHPYIYVELFLVYEKISDDIYAGSRYAEDRKSSYFQIAEKRHERKNEKKDQTVYNKSQLFDSFLIHTCISFQKYYLKIIIALISQDFN